MPKEEQIQALYQGKTYEHRILIYEILTLTKGLTAKFLAKFSDDQLYAYRLRLKID